MEPLVPPSGLQQNIPEEKSEVLKIDLWIFILFFFNLQFTCFYTVQLPLCAQQTKMIIVWCIFSCYNKLIYTVLYIFTFKNNVTFKNQ